MIDLNIDSISLLCLAEDRHIPTIKEKKVSMAMKRLINNKAVDVMCLTS